ncbi:hypothetical protein [Streptomyces sp. URMC 125]
MKGTVEGASYAEEEEATSVLLDEGPSFPAWFADHELEEIAE